MVDTGGLRGLSRVGFPCGGGRSRVGFPCGHGSSIAIIIVYIGIGTGFSKFVSKTDPCQHFRFLEISIKI